MVEPISNLNFKESAKIQPAKAQGFFQTLRHIGAWITLSIFVFVPWISWHGRQAILVDFLNRKFYFFNLTFWPQDLIILASLVLFIIFTLFFITTLAGRIWCGYFCPQTVWVKLFLLIERFAEGRWFKRIKLDKSTLTFEKFYRRGSKHLLWILLSFFTGFVFVSYFTPVKSLLDNLLHLRFFKWSTFFILLFTVGTYINAGWMREKICVLLCPYARLQGGMFDPDTLIISYDEARGEPRSHRHSHIQHRDLRKSNLGDCIDCHRCFRVCPTGIDIRDGLQIECIACAACIDACDNVMKRLNYPKGLIRYTTENALAEKKRRLIRERLLANALLVLLTGALFTTLITTRVPFRLDVLRANRMALYRETVNGKISNDYILRVINMTQSIQHYRLKVSGIKGVDYLDEKDIVADANQITSIPVQIVISPDKLTQSNLPVTFTLSVEGRPNLKVTDTTRFIGPSKGME